MPHQGGQFRQVLRPELVQGRLERLLADLVGLEKLCGVVDYRRFRCVRIPRLCVQVSHVLQQRVPGAVTCNGTVSKIAQKALCTRRVTFLTLDFVPNNVDNSSLARGSGRTGLSLLSVEI